MPAITRQIGFVDDSDITVGNRRTGFTSAASPGDEPKRPRVRDRARAKLPGGCGEMPAGWTDRFLADSLCRRRRRAILAPLEMGLRTGNKLVLRPGQSQVLSERRARVFPAQEPSFPQDRSDQIRKHAQLTRLQFDEHEPVASFLIDPRLHFVGNVLGGAHEGVLGEPKTHDELPDRETLIARDAEHLHHIALKTLGEAFDRAQREWVVQAILPEIEPVERTAEVIDRSLQSDGLPAPGLDGLGRFPRRRDERRAGGEE